MVEMIDDGLSELHDSRFSESETLDTIVEWAQQAVDGTDAGIFLLQPKDALEIAVPTSPGAARAHELQIDLAEGPCLEVIADADGVHLSIKVGNGDPRHLLFASEVDAARFMGRIYKSIKLQESAFSLLRR
jgi:hypothetical protein